MIGAPICSKAPSKSVTQCDLRVHDDSNDFHIMYDVLWIQIWIPGFP